MRVDDGKRLISSTVYSHWPVDQAVDEQPVLGRIDRRYLAVMTLEIERGGVMIPFKSCSGVSDQEAVLVGLSANVRSRCTKGDR